MFNEPLSKIVCLLIETSRNDLKSVRDLLVAAGIEREIFWIFTEIEIMKLLQTQKSPDVLPEEIIEYWNSNIGPWHILFHFADGPSGFVIKKITAWEKTELFKIYNQIDSESVDLNSLAGLYSLQNLSPLEIIQRVLGAELEKAKRNPLPKNQRIIESIFDSRKPTLYGLEPQVFFEPFASMGQSLLRR